MDKNNLTLDTDFSQRMEFYHLQGFDHMQLEELEEGLKSGVDVSFYADKKYMFLQMAEIRKGLEQDLDITPYLDEGYDWYQMREIRRGLKDKLDVSIYLDKNMDYLAMREIRLGLACGIDLTDYYKKGYENSILREIREAYADNINIDLYVDTEYSASQLREIRLGLKNGVDITYYLDHAFTGSQMYEVRAGLEDKLDVSVYCKHDYNWMQMRELRLGLKSSIDTEWYEDPLFSPKQMREIRLGLEEGLDVSGYASQIWSASDMQSRKEKLIAFGKAESDLFNPDAEVLSYDEDDVGISETGLDEEDYSDVKTDRISIEISADAMFAYAVLPETKGETDFTEKEITYALKQSGIRQGIIKEAVDDIVSGKRAKEEKVLIAQGKEPTDGEDGYYEYFFNREIDITPVLNEDGSVDYSNTVLFEQVEEGQTLAVYHPASHGIYGYDVTGKLIHPENGKSLPKLNGKEITLLDDEVTYVAKITGCIEENNGTITISTIYRVNGDVSLSSGNIRFDGDVIINGNVNPRVTIEATGNVTINGSVEAAFIKAGKDVLIKQGTLGRGIGIIEAGDDVNGKYFENVKIYAEHNVKSNYLYNCRCVAMNKVIISGRKGAIVGGVTSAIYGVEAAELGNRTGLRTELEIGANQYFIEKLRGWDQRIKDLSVKITVFNEELKKLQVKIKLDILKNNPVYQNVQTAIRQLTNEMEEVRAERDAFTQEVAQNATSIGVRVTGKAYAGCLVGINNAKLLLNKDESMVWFREKEGGIIQLLN